MQIAVQQGEIAVSAGDQLVILFDLASDPLSFTIGDVRRTEFEELVFLLFKASDLVLELPLGLLELDPLATERDGVQIGQRMLARKKMKVAKDWDKGSQHELRLRSERRSKDRKLAVCVANPT